MRGRRSIAVSRPKAPVFSHCDSVQRRGKPLQSVPCCAPIAQMDRVLVSEAKGHRFDSCWARHFPFCCSVLISPLCLCWTQAWAAD